MNQKESDNLGHPPTGGHSVQELQSLVSQKEGVLRSKSRLIDNMAYQIRTLSNAVIGFSDLLLIEPLSPDLMEYAKEINQAGNGLSSLVNEVLDWARIESGRMQLTMTKCNTGEMVSEIEKMVASIASAKGLTYSVNAAGDLPQFILSDADRLNKCVTNLAVNAVKNMSHGTLKVQIASENRNGRACVRFSVTDESTDLTAETIAHLFEPAQEEDANTEILSMLNMGLTVTAGLPLTRQLAEALGGTIEVSSRPQSGTTFCLVIPAGSVPAEARKPEKVICEDKPAFREQKREAEQSGSTLVLLVEDQPSNRTVISLMLESLGVQVDTAEDGLSGIEAASQKEYGLILMDLKMPRMDGYEAARAIRQKNSRTPIIALSAKVLNEGENKQIASLFDGFLSKPIDSQKLAETLHQYMSGLLERSGSVAALKHET